MSKEGNPVDDRGGAKRTGWFESRVIHAQFGRFRGDHVADREADGLLIGRDAQRAQLITALLDNTHRGAYLVTGHRGSGKTTLVNHCLKEYNEAAYERYLNRHVGRAILWDRLALFVFVSALIFLFQVLHDLLAIVAVGSQGKSVEPFLFLIKIAIIGILSIPLLNAWNILSFIAEAVLDLKRLPFKGAIVLGVFLIVLLAVIWPTVDSRLINSASTSQLLMVWVACLPIACILAGRLREAWLRVLVTVSLGLVVGWLFALIRESHIGWVAFAVQLLLAGFVASQRVLSSRRMDSLRRGPESKFQRLVDWATQNGLNRTLVTSLTLAVWAWASFQDAFHLALYIWISLLTIGLGISIGKQVEIFQVEDYERHLRPLSLMVVKAIALIALSVQMMLPLAGDFRWLQEILPDRFGAFGAGSITSKVSNLGPFLASIEVPGFVVTSAAVFTLIFFLEFEWIARVRARFRKDRPLVHRIRWALGFKSENFGSQKEECEPGSSRRESHSSYKAADEGDNRTRVDWQQVRSLEKRLFSLTFFYVVFQQWNPLLVVPVNLGFDALDHRRVIEAMLSCLREQYERAFTSWRSPIESLKIIVQVAAALYLTFALSFHLFYINDFSRALLDGNHYCEQARQPSKVLPGLSLDKFILSYPPGMITACSLGGESLARLVQTNILYRARRSTEQVGTDGTITSEDGPPPLEIAESSILSRIIQELGSSSPETSEVLTLRIYHLLSFLVLLSVLSYLSHRYWPYYKISRHLKSLTASLTGKTREDRFELQSIWSRLAGVFLGSERKSLVEVEPLDPRAVEVWTLELMKKMQEFQLVLPYSARHHLSLPAPEILFKLDELDKLGVGVIPEHDSSGPEVEPTQGLDLERRRSKALHNLFSEMKNLLSAGAARFVFIGGRTLHDEWLADLSARRPLLTNIFDVEIHLPSMLTENLECGSDPNPDLNIRWLLFHTYRECKHNQIKADVSRSYFVHGAQEEEAPSRYSQAERTEIISTEAGRALARGMYSNTQMFWKSSLAAGSVPEKYQEWQSARLINDYVDFLAYRSRGNPRRLLAMIESFLDSSVNVRRICHIDHSWSAVANDDHSLVFRDADIYRIQLISEIYRRFRDALGARLDLDDDKLVVGALYVSDFLLKFHRRAFGWSNLQRVDELVHIHRAPDLPSVFSNILDAWSERYLHPIRNGMYDYRFNSEFSRELRYLSRQSEEELAAVNFTLDESQALKTIYRLRFRQLQDDQAYEFIAALGELHEFDEEYEIARFYYRKSISYLDSRLKESLSLHENDSPLHLVLMQEKEGLEIGRRRVNWALARLRLGLQVGMSYERSEDFEQAQAHYRNSRTFAAAILRSLLNAERVAGREVVLPLYPDRGRPDFSSTLKHFNLLFQPVFAEGWVCEKLRGGVDTSVRVIERSIWEVRWILPAVREEFDGENITLKAGGLRSFRRQHLNFFLTMAEQHNKLGDLLFYKACPSVKPMGMNESRNGGGEESSAGSPVRRSTKRLADFGGFLGRAHYHYAVSLHELRSFLSLRLERGKRMQYPDWQVSHTDASPSMSWPDFVVDASSHSLADLADTLISRVSLCDCLVPDTNPGKIEEMEEIFERQSEGFKRATAEFKRWLERIPRGVPEKPEEGNWSGIMGKLIEGLSGEFHLNQVLGIRQAVLPDGGVAKSEDSVDRDKNIESLEKTFAKNLEHSEQRRYKKLAEGDVQALISLKLELGGPRLLAFYATSLMTASDILEEGGHYEDSARKASRVVEMAALYLFMARAVEWILKGREDKPIGVWDACFSTSTPANSVIRQIASLGMVAAERSCRLFKKARHRIVGRSEELNAGRLIPTSLCAHLCGLGLHTSALFDEAAIAPVLDLVQTYFGDHLLNEEGNAEFLRKALRVTLENNAYPILGRLHGLKTLADDQILSCSADYRGSSYLEELEATAEAFDSSLHFTPFHLGTSRALSVIAGLASKQEVSNAQKYEALETLKRSTAMYSMQITFYRTIDNLYYLHDDFNDRRVHSCHALQMAGAELTELLKERLEQSLEPPRETHESASDATSR